MGVMPCSRRNCPRILCDRYSSHYGYLCDSCFEELVHLGPSADVEEFMNSEPEAERLVTSHNHFDSLFPRG